MYVTYYGCATYPSVFYTNDPSIGGHEPGSIMLCNENKAFPVVGSLYYVSYVTITSFCIIPFFISAVFISMSDYVDAMREINKQKHREECVQRLSDKMITYNTHYLIDTQTKISLKYLNIAFKGLDIMQFVSLEDTICGPGVINAMIYNYQKVAMKCHTLQENSMFRKIIVCVITIGG